MVICLERGADLHMAQLMPLPLTVSCFSKIQIGFTFLVLAHWVVPEKAVATLLGNSLGQTVYTHCASVHQAAKLVAALLRSAGVIAGLSKRKVTAAYRRVYDSRHLQADCQEPGSAPEPYVR